MSRSSQEEIAAASKKKCTRTADLQRFLAVHLWVSELPNTVKDDKVCSCQRQRRMSDSEKGDVDVVVGEMPVTMVRKHIKKRALRNKSLSISFDEKNLRDYVSGFHKRKKKRRKEAQRQLQEKERLKQIEARKRRKLEKEMAIHDGNITENPEPDYVGEDGEEEGADLIASVFETKTYETGDTTIRVTTTELSREDEDVQLVNHIPKLSCEIQKNHSLPMMKKPLKRARAQKPQKARKHAPKKKDKRKSKVK
ncbi:hypothetical protein J5N97_013167 [Dioscorea zingiberensis]|uniref:Ribosomal RNA-processing protein 17 n=1 Tax=Dioscorea zingiberensis TaxID=325984 RepID=A0A9D5CSX3_9LILI|nr:hypothetical protein J5N97_013167 [Dioscorea zingiberensis]